MYAEMYGVDESLEPLAQWIQWADSGSYGDPACKYNLNQFWAAKARIVNPQGDVAWGLTVLDAHAHKILGHAYLSDLTKARPEDLKSLASLAHQAFLDAAQEYSDAGLEDAAKTASLRASQMGEWVSDVRLNYVDDSMATAWKDSAQKALDAAGKAVDAASSPFGIVTGLVVLAVIGAVVIGGRR